MNEPSKNPDPRRNRTAVIPVRAVVRGFRGQRRNPGARILHDPQQSSSHHVQVHQAAGDEQAGGVLIETAVADFAEAEDAFQDQERMLHFGSHLRLGPVPGLILIGQRVIAAALLMGKVFRIRRVFTDNVALPHIGRVAPYPGFFAMQQVSQHLAVMHVRRRGRDRMDQLRPAVDANVAFHAEVPLVTLAGLMHLRVASLVFVPGRTGGIDDRRIHDGAGIQLQAVFLKVRVDQAEQLVTQVMGFKKMPELADRSFIRYRFPAQVDPDKSPHRARVIQGLFHGRVGQVEPMLQEMNAQHPFQTDRPTPRAFRLRIEWLVNLAQVAPGDYLVHLAEKLFPTGRLAKFLEAFIGHVFCRIRYDSG
jgi:hypothetical protein